MKKLLGILVLGLLVCDIGLAKPKAEKFKYQSYNVSGFDKLFRKDFVCDRHQTKKYTINPEPISLKAFSFNNILPFELEDN